MADGTHIEWTDASWNPLVAYDRETGKRGWFCTKVSAGCTNCYAEPINVRLGNGHKYRVGEAEKVRFDLVNLDAPLRWRKPRRVFVNSMTDLFHEDVSDWLIAQVWATMVLARRHTFQILTKRPERMAALLAAPYFYDLVLEAANEPRSRFEWAGAVPIDNPAFGAFFPHIWLGTSVENQEAADERIPHLLSTPAAVRFLSCEPLLGPITLDKIGRGPWYSPLEGWTLDESGVAASEPCAMIDWVIVGGESGPKARACAVEWIAEIVAECQSTFTPCFVKQLGKIPVERLDAWKARTETTGLARVITPRYMKQEPAGYVAWSMSDSKGGNPNDWPESLRVREFPREVASV